MKTITQNHQLEIWEQEHQNPQVLLQMDAKKPSGGVVKFWEWLQEKGLANNPTGLEMCCGKGRSVIWLAGQGAKMTGFDFSPTAIEQAKRRAEKPNTEASFITQDATQSWQLPSSSFNFIIDCFAGLLKY